MWYQPRAPSWWLLPPCQVPLSSIFPVWMGLCYFSSLDLKQMGGKLLRVVGLRGSCMPVIIPSESWLDRLFFCTLLTSWWDLNVSLLVFCFNVSFICLQDWGASLLTLVIYASSNDPVFWSTFDSFSQWHAFTPDTCRNKVVRAIWLHGQEY